MSNWHTEDPPTPTGTNTGGALLFLIAAAAVIAIIVFGGNLVNDLTGNTLRIEQERTARIEAQSYAAAEAARARADAWQSTTAAATIVVPVVIGLIVLCVAAIVITDTVLTAWQRADDARRTHELLLLAAARPQPRVYRPAFPALPAPDTTPCLLIPVSHRAPRPSAITIYPEKNA